jgi:poly(3-hydroxybutyrate) depolymerase
MRKFYPIFLAGLLCLFCSTFVVISAHAQVQTPRYIATGPNSNGFYEYLPAGYSSTGTEKYPLLVFLHGSDELGNGTTDLPKILDDGSPPDLISEGLFPTSFTVNGQTFSFIVISPQFVVWPQDTDVANVINYSLAHYNVDTNRVYLTGLSMGGSAVWSYAPEEGHAQKLAGIVPIAGGLMYTEQYGASVLAQNNVAVFAAANLNDPTVASSYTVQDIQYLNAAGINPPALDTIYNASGHGGWTITYDPTTNLHNGLNLYQYMLQFSKASTSVPLPIKLADFTATLAGGTNEVSLDWTTTFEENNHYFLIQRSADGATFSTIDTVAAAVDAENGHTYTYTDLHPLSGANYYRLDQVDLDGTANYSLIREVYVGQNTSGGLELVPNPADATVYLTIGGNVSGSMQVRLLDVQGRTLRSWIVQKPEGSWNQALDVSGLAAGSYFVQVVGTNYRETTTLIKK